MEWKDVGNTVGTVVALIISGYSLYLTKRRDEREFKEKLPSADVRLPHMTGQGPWQANLIVINRLPDTVCLEGIFSPVASFIRVTNTASVTRREGSDVLTGFAIARDIEPGERFEGVFELEISGVVQLPFDLPVIFYVDLFVRNGSQDRHRLPVRRIAHV